MALNISSIPPQFSKTELLLRSFFGFMYIVIPHVVIIVLHIPKILLHYAKHTHCLIKGEVNNFESEVELVSLINWLGNLHRSVYNLMDGYPVIGLKNQTSLLKVQKDANNQLLWILISPFVVVVTILYVVTVTPFIGLATFVAFFVVLITNKYPKTIYIIQLMHLNVVLSLLSKILLGK